MCASRSQQHTSSLSCVVQIGTYGAHHLSTPRSKLNHRTRLLEEYIWILIPLRILNTPQTFPFILSHKKKLCIICLLWNSRDLFFYFLFFSLSTFGAERIGLQTAVFRGLNSHAIWRQGSVVATDIDHLFTLYPRRWYKKHHLGKGVAAFESMKAAATKKSF